MNFNLYTPILCLSIFLFFLLPVSVRAQDTLPTGISRDSSIHATLVQGGKYAHIVYSANGDVLSRRDIVARLQLYPEPADELQQYSNARTGGFVWVGVMLASTIGAAVEKRQNNIGAGDTFAGCCIGALIGAFVSSASAERHLKQAIRIYNRRFVP